MSYKTICLIEGVSGALFITDGGGSASWSPDVVNASVPTNVQRQRFFLDDGGSGIKNNRLILESCGQTSMPNWTQVDPTAKPFQLTYTGASWPSGANATFPLRIYCNDVAFVGNNGVDISNPSSRTPITVGSVQQLTGASCARIDFTPIGVPTVSSVSPSSVNAGTPAAITVTLDKPLHPSVNWSPSLTWSPSTAFTSGTVATNKDSGGFITGWTFNVSVPQQASSKVTLKFGLTANGITYLKGNSIVTENRTFIDATLPQGVNVTADSTPPGIGAVTFRPHESIYSNGVLMRPEVLNTGGATTCDLLTISQFSGGTYYGSSGILQVGVTITSPNATDDLNPVLFQLVDASNQSNVLQKSSVDGELVLTSSGTSLGGATRSYVWAIRLGNTGALGSGCYMIQVIASRTGGQSASYTCPTYVYDMNIYPATMAFVHLVERTSQLDAAITSTTQFFSFRPSSVTSMATVSGFVQFFISAFQFTRYQQSLLSRTAAQKASIADAVSSAELYLDGAKIATGTLVSDDFSNPTYNVYCPWNFGVLNTAGWANGNHKLNFHLIMEDASVWSSGDVLISVSNYTGGGGGGGGCVPYDALISTDTDPLKAGEVQVGDRLLVYNPLTKGLSIRPVREVIPMGVQPCLRFSLEDGTTTVCSDTHRVFSPDQDGYVEARSLKVGNKVRNSLGNDVDIVSVTPAESQEVITFSIDDPICKNYFADGVLAHNLKSKDCVLPGTLVSMSDGGYRPIETLKAGDSVLTLNERTQEVESDTVLSRFLTANSDLVKLTTSTGKSVVCSKTHTLLSEALCPEWVAVQNLTVGSKVVVAGGVDTLVDIQPYQAPEGTIVYILEMEKNHNFFAGDILCHNYIKQPQQYDEVVDTQI